MKICRKCKKEKSNDCFGHEKRNKDKLTSYCKSCDKDRIGLYHKTKKGLITSIINTQRQSSKVRGHSKPNYTISELRDWAYSQEIFHLLHELWVLSKYDKWERPSFDRINSDKPYTLDNIQIVTWRDNLYLNSIDISIGVKKNSGLLNGGHRKIIAIDPKTGNEHKYISTTKAAKALNISQGNISSVCRGIRNHAGGYKFKYVQ